ncbi:MAG: sodium:proton exchanger, partial [Deltaproteobacteria bacterium]|nr:sodium:proton exchanger [Deltaproteobacteria bacterium]MBM4351983.1 sodium:proton exchanger [Deltaproteobacteria bacterium]
MPEIFLQNVFHQFVVLLLMAAGVGTLAILFKQPLIVGYIVVGIVAGPSVLGKVIPQDQVDLLSKTGIAILLFVVGLRLDLHLIRTL